MKPPRCTCSVYANEPSRSCPKHGRPTLRSNLWAGDFLDYWNAKMVLKALAEFAPIIPNFDFQIKP